MVSRLSRTLYLVGVLIFSPALLILAARRRVDTKSTPNILVIPQLTRLGDLVCSTPVFRAIKVAYPQARLTVLVSKKYVQIIKNNPRINEILILEDYSFFALAKKIRTSRFDTSFSLVGTSTNTLLMLLGLIPERVKTVRHNRPSSELLTDWLATKQFLYKDHTYLPGHYLTLLSVIEIDKPEEVKEVFPTPEGDTKAAALLDSAHTWVGISITAGNKIKEWGDDRFVDLAQQIVTRYDCRIVVLGGPSDRERVAAVVEKIGTATAVATTTFSVEELPSLMQRLALFISVDTGPIYVAHALRVPLIDIIGPVDPLEQPPSDERSMRVLPGEGVTPSSFVFKRPGTTADHKRAISSISVDMVLKAVETLAPVWSRVV